MEIQKIGNLIPLVNGNALLNSGYSAVYRNQVVVTPTDTISFNDIPFDPKALMIKCNDSQQNVYNLISVVKSNNYAMYSAFIVLEGFASEQPSGNIPQMIQINKTASTTSPILESKTAGNTAHPFLTSVSNGDGTYTVTLYMYNTTTNSFNFIAPTNGFNIVFIG